MAIVYLDKQETILQIRANPADPELFALFFCADCGRIVAAGGLFPALADQTEHAGHALAHLPAQDPPAGPGMPNPLINGWLEAYRAQLPVERYSQLQALAQGFTASDNWVWVLQGSEQQGWLVFLSSHLDRLASAWLAALNGHSSEFFPHPETVWYHRALQQPEFGWSKTGSELNEILSKINPAFV